MLLYAGLRFGVTFCWSAYQTIAFGLNQAQLVSLAALAIGLPWLVYLLRQREPPPRPCRLNQRTMNEQLVKEGRRTPWIILAGVLTVAVIFGLPFLRPAPELHQNGNPPSAELTPDLAIQPAENNPNFTKSPDEALSATVVVQSPAPATPFPTPVPPSISAVTAGQPAPEFDLKTIDGDSVTLSDLRGQPVIINFWASWCYPCRLEMPGLERVYQTHQAEGLTVLGINVTTQDTLAEAQAFVAEFAPRSPSCWMKPAT